MGQLGNQKPRDYFRSSLTEYVKDLKEIASKTGTSIENVIAAANVVELQRRNDAAIQNGDYWDEQIGGLGAILERMADNLEQ